MTSTLLLLLGLVTVTIGAELVVRHGAELAGRLRISPLVVGMTVVSLGTSLPELAIGLKAAQQGTPGLAVGNIVGTNLVNILLILGLAALLRPVTFELRTLRFDLPAMSAAAVLFFVLARDGSLSTTDGVVLTAYGFAYLVATAVLARGDAKRRPGPSAGAHERELDPGRPPGPLPGAPVAASPGPDPRRAALLVLGLVLGLVVIVVGSEWLVTGAIEVARSLGASDAVIGLTVVAVGTSAPELVTTLVSTFRGGDRSLALGNLLGSSVFNIALILGPTVLAAPGSVAVPDDVLALDLVLLTATAVTCVPAFITRRRLSRAEGAAFILTYIAYMAWLLATRI